MGVLSDYAESGFINWIFRANSNSFTRPTGIALALCRNVPSESQTGATIPEVSNAGAYARLPIAQNNSNWVEYTQVATSGFSENVSDLLFTTASADWGMVSGWAIVDSASYGTGNVWMCSSFPTARDIKSGDAVVIRAGSLDIYVG
jgi:hypothetical protein